jgi:hypothetical protein
MSARGDILAAIKFNRPSGQHILPVVPRFAVPGRMLTRSRRSGRISSRWVDG